jgi:hypothetical protein
MNRQFLFETLLFFQRKPCYYRFFSDGSTIVGEPAPHPFYAHVPFPVFKASHTPGEWKIEGVEDELFIQRVLHELRQLHGEVA